MIKLAIFDMDGVLTETSHYHYLAWKALAKSIGVDIDEAFNETLKGVSRRDSLIKILHHGEVYEKYEDQIEDLMVSKNDHYKTLIQEVSPKDLFVGVKEIFKILNDHGIKIAVGSASKNAPFLIEKLGIKEDIDYIVNPSTVRGKPHPDIFLDAAKHFDIDPSQCVGIEDAVAGVEAIKSAGMYAVGIGENDVLTGADVVFKTVEDSIVYFNELKRI
jgi:beta-phosphoglucomutase